MKAFDLKSELPAKHAQPVRLIHFRIALFCSWRQASPASTYSRGAFCAGS